MEPIIFLADEGTLMPYWVTDKPDTILKVQDKFIGSIESLEQGKVYSINADFESYCIEIYNQEPSKGYFLKVPQIISCAIQIDSDRGNNSDIIMTSPTQIMENST